jgi:hypothetical protein
MPAIITAPKPGGLSQRLRPSALAPAKRKAARARRADPGDLDRATRRGKRAVNQGVIHELVDHQRQGLDDEGRDQHLRSGQGQSACGNSRQLLADDAVQRRLLPATLREQAMGVGQGLNPLLNGLGIAHRIVGPGQANDAVDDSEDIARTVIDFLEQAVLRRLQRLHLAEFRHIDLGSEEVEQRAGLIVPSWLQKAEPSLR